MITGCSDYNQPILDVVAATQTWDCPDSEGILEKCTYQVVATDMMAATMD